MCFITFGLSLCFQPLSDVSIPGHTVFYLPYFFGFSHRFRGPLGTPCLTRFPLKSWMHLFHINLNILHSKRPESIVIQSQNEVKVRESENLSVMSDSLWPHGLYSPQNSPVQNTGVGSHSLLQGIFPTQESNWDLLHCRQIFLPAELPGKPRLGKCPSMKNKTRNLPAKHHKLSLL